MSRIVKKKNINKTNQEVLVAISKEESGDNELNNSEVVLTQQKTNESIAQNNKLEENNKIAIDSEIKSLLESDSD